MESNPQGRELTTALTLQIDVVNTRGTVDSEELLEFLKAELPLEAVLTRRRWPTEPQLDGGATWLVVLTVGASAVTIGDVLWRAYKRFVKPMADRGEGAKPGLLIEMRNGDESFRLIKIGPNSDQREVVVQQVTESLEILGNDGSQGGVELTARLERSEKWIRIK